jgi:hypothetical protein
VTWASFAGKTYHIQVTGHSSELINTGKFNLTVSNTNAGLIETDDPGTCILERRDACI